MNRDWAEKFIRHGAQKYGLVGDAEPSALKGLLRDIRNPSVTADMLLDFGYSLDDPFGSQVRDVIKQLPDWADWDAPDDVWNAAMEARQSVPVFASGDGVELSHNQQHKSDDQQNNADSHQQMDADYQAED